MQKISLFPAEIQHILPDDVAGYLSSSQSGDLQRVTEIRLRIGRKPHLVGPEVYLPVLVTKEHMRSVLATLTQSSMYAVETELRNGFITLSGGHRVGIAGKVILDSAGSVQTIRDISSVNIRLAREIKGCAQSLMGVVLHGVNKVRSTLLFGPPSSGKTTLLRDLARILGSGDRPMKGPLRVTLIDERSEIAGTISGVPQFDVGIATDVLDGCPKTIGMTMALRALSPEVLVVDELGSAKDASAVADLARAGVSLIGSAHAGSITDLFYRAGMKAIKSQQIIERYVLLKSHPAPGTIDRVYDRQLREVVNPWPGSS